MIKAAALNEFPTTTISIRFQVTSAIRLAAPDAKNAMDVNKGKSALLVFVLMIVSKIERTPLLGDNRTEEYRY
jgi:hypothetical protein